MDIRFPNTGIAQPSEKNAFNRSALRDGVLRLDPAQFEALLTDLNWRHHSNAGLCATPQ